MTLQRPSFGPSPAPPACAPFDTCGPERQTGFDDAMSALLQPTPFEDSLQADLDPDDAHGEHDDATA